jgi:hypothetical protein
MVECTTAVHVNFVIIPQMCNKETNITSHSTLRASIGAVIWPEAALCFMLYLAVVWEDFRAT